jgi:hypothetical protein
VEIFKIFFRNQKEHRKLPPGCNFCEYLTATYLEFLNFFKFCQNFSDFWLDFENFQIFMKLESWGFQRAGNRMAMSIFSYIFI